MIILSLTTKKLKKKKTLSTPLYLKSKKIQGLFKTVRTLIDGIF